MLIHMVGAKGFEPSTLWSQTMAMLSDLFQINDLRTPKLLEVAHWCLWMKIELAQKSRRPYCKLCMPEPRVHQAGLGINADAYNVRYVEADSAFAHYSLAGADEQRKLLGAMIEHDLLVLDDLFLARRIADASAELLQAVVHQRYKLRRDIVVTSNRVVQDWGKYLGDKTMSTTILDRLMHRSTLLEFEGKSYRLKDDAARMARDTSND